GGVSRSHFSRTFTKILGEGVHHFAARISLERAGFLLRHTNRSVGDLASESGYGSPEAFCRSFRASFETSPGQFRLRTRIDWKLPCPSDLHWNPHMAALKGLGSSRYNVDLVQMPPRRLAFIRVVGDYRNQATGWHKLGLLLGDSLPPRATF